MKKLVLAILLSLLITLLPTASALAIAYSITITISNNSSSLTMYPAMVSMNVSGLVSGGYISSSGLDVKVTSGATEWARLLAEDRVLFAAPVVTGTNTFTMTTNNTLSSDFDIISGYSGNISVADSAGLELGSQFRIEFTGYIDATAIGSFWLKGASFQFSISGGTITASITGGGSVSHVITTGSHSVAVLADNTTLYLYIDSVLEDSDAQVVAVPNTADNITLFNNNVCPYVEWIKVWLR